MTENHNRSLHDAERAEANDHPGRAEAGREGRRRFLKGAAAAAPIIMTVASRPVWAARNCTESGQLSGNLSDGQAYPPCGGEGCTQGFWKNHTYLWYPDYQPSDLFNTIFGRTAWPAGATLLDVITGAVHCHVPGGCTPHGGCQNVLDALGAQAVAALQNAATSVSYDLTADQVILAFQQAYDLGTKSGMEQLKNGLDGYNNQRCPLP